MTSDAFADALDRLADSIKTVAVALRQDRVVASQPSVVEEPPQWSRRLLLTPRQLAAELNVAEQTLAKWRLSGSGPRYCKFGRLVRYDLEEVVKWAEIRRYAHTTEQQAANVVNAGVGR
jgi:Helix-turn-helix domain